jgi:transcriptional regulator with PAS, ATPase and Fis domain
LAKGGALFLDDVEVMSLSMQAHLLRALQEHAYRPLGATRVERTDARFILASNQNVLELVRKGTFRSDLYYRVNVVRLELPPLRRRKEDVPFLVEQMVERFNRLASRFLHGIEPEALAVLMTYDWPGNVRELHNTIEHAFIKCDGHLIRIEHLPPEVTAIATLSSSDPDNCGEIQAIRAALVRNSFNRKATAKELGIAKTTLLRRMRRGGIQAYKDGRTKPISQ